MATATKKAASKSKSNGISVPLDLTRETKNTFRFDSDDEDAVITSLYVKKSAFPKGAPESITVTVS